MTSAQMTRDEKIEEVSRSLWNSFNDYDRARVVLDLAGTKPEVFGLPSGKGVVLGTDEGRAQLAALPAGTVILDAANDLLRQWRNTRGHVRWAVMEGDSRPCSDVALPALILWVGPGR